MINSQYKILVVDDLPDWRNTLKGLLSDVGYSVYIAESFTGALEWLKINKFDLAVVDFRLDESNEDDEGGLILASVIKRDWPHIKIILITGYGKPERLRQATQVDIKTGQVLADDYLPKTETDKLVSIIQRILAE